MAKLTLEQLRNCREEEYHQLFIFPDEDLSFSRILEHIDILQQVSREEQIKIASSIVYMCTHTSELVAKLDQFVTDNCTQEQGSSSTGQDFLALFSQASQFAKKLLTLKDSSNHDVHAFFTDLPKLSDIPGNNYRYHQIRINDDFREMFRCYTPFESLAFNIFELHQEAIAINLARHCPELYRQEILIKCSRGFNRDFHNWVQNAFRVDLQLKLFLGDEPHLALINQEVPRLDYYSGSYEELFVSELYSRYRFFVHERLAGKEREIAQKLEFHMTPELLDLLRGLEKDSRDIHMTTDCYSAPFLILQNLQDVSTFSSHLERFGIFRAVTLSICPQEERERCTIL